MRIASTVPMATPPGLVHVRGGTFRMGTSQFPWAQPVRTVIVSDRYFGANLVTNAEYRNHAAREAQLPPYALQAQLADGSTAIWARGTDPAQLMAEHHTRVDYHAVRGLKIIAEAEDASLVVPSPRGFDEPTQPVVCVTWEEALRYCQRYAAQLTESTGQRWVGRLPTEAEWEHAARAGRTGDKVAGTDTGKVEQRDGTPSGYNAHWNGRGDVFTTAPVGSYTPNAFGLYDMAGNAWEWCMDRYVDGYHHIAEGAVDPTGPASGEHRVVRGGSWAFDNAERLLAGGRNCSRPADRSKKVGFRVVVWPEDLKA